MPVYLLKCAKGHKFEVVVPMAEAPSVAQCACGKEARRDYAEEHPTSFVGMIDGEQFLYGPPEIGPYVDPGRSLKRRIANNHSWHETMKKNEHKFRDMS